MLNKLNKFLDQIQIIDKNKRAYVLDEDFFYPTANWQKNNIVLTINIENAGDSFSFKNINTARVLWGDGFSKIGNDSSSETFSHTYDMSGEYQVVIVLRERQNVSIGAEAFQNCISLRNAVIPNGVSLIGTSAFRDCYNLVGITISNRVTSIGANAFNGCTSLKTLTIPVSTTTIGADAFLNCPLETLTIPCSLINTVPKTNLISVNIIGSGNIAASALAYAPSLVNVTIGDNIGAIGERAFHNCSSLTNVIIGNSVTSIGMLAFDRNKLTSIVIPDSVTSIGEQAFYFCDKIVSVTIGASVSSIGNDAFKDCSALLNTGHTYYNGTISDWCKIEFGTVTSNPVVYTHGLYINNQLTTNITIPGDLVSIQSYAFRNCDSLTSATFENTIGWSAGGTSISSSDLANTSTAATYLKNTYSLVKWERSV